MVSPLVSWADSAPKGEPVIMAPFAVKEPPFGFLGIKHATVVFNPWKFCVGMNSVRFLQIDELDPSSPGVAAGIRPGDRIVSIDGVPIISFGLRKLRRLGDEVVVGQKIVIELLRPGDKSKLIMEVTVPKKPSKPKTPVATIMSATLIAGVPVALATAACYL